MRCILFTLLLAPAILFGQSNGEKNNLIDMIGLSASINAVADEAVIGGNLFAERNLYNWELGRAYAGIGIFYGQLGSTDTRVNKYADGKATLIQPIQLKAGHQLYFLKKRFGVRTELVAGPSIFKQAVSYKDDRFAVDQSFSYTHTSFTMHGTAGLSVRTGPKSRLEVFVNIPIIDQNIAPLGIGLGLSKQLSS